MSGSRTPTPSFYRELPECSTGCDDALVRNTSDGRPSVSGNSNTVDPPVASSSPNAEGLHTPPVLRLPSRQALGSTVTYSDLPDGYSAVARSLKVLPTASEGQLAYIPDGWIELVDDEDSVAIVVASGNRSGSAFVSNSVITHRKLRFLLNDAVGWYLKAQDVADNTVQLYTSEQSPGPDDDETDGPQGLRYLQLQAEGAQLTTPHVRDMDPPPRKNTSITTILALVGVFTLVAVGIGLMESELGQLNQDVVQDVINTIHAFHALAQMFVITIWSFSLWVYSFLIRTMVYVMPLVHRLLSAANLYL
ncbi:hypothetical protein GY45DRAFT_1376258 [Cubamyces sp. BRFM 1775]|nr:hypothetical protein GY45DRAFT_1376258 [Cubamyces sp. BRFM 1775]